ncbi:TIR domain-containing adapter molecule 1 isoform X2 [Sarcophilus harrisii]|uniref:TIR domain-containing adapter molecule 1 n=1 Tax=Sarcophilus harrisii TaxID=9305 RepID=A0A7N4PX41_SARHA|nr:TIR domain-containing adapter molecule 1 isoform X1 [Sarcophilus harrisii]XP_031803670.1 TIR domain-containing adapter molecule 1 isoform X2 [Sarcophilus harrisii]
MGEDIPSLKGAFDILNRAGQDKLLYLKHKLKLLQPSSKGSGLLHAMVLLTLGQKTEARILLDSLRGDKAALSMAKTWESREPDQMELLPSEEQADIQLAVARIYQLLLEEKLCDASARNQAYYAALRTLHQHHDARLDSIWAEVQFHCSRDVCRTKSFQTLRSDMGYLPVSPKPSSRISSQPWPIRERSDVLAPESLPLTLRSTGSPASFPSKLDISQSPTLAFFTCQPQKGGPKGPSKLCGDPQSDSTEASGPEETSLWACSDPAASLSEQLDSSVPGVSGSQAPRPSTSPSPAPSVAPETSRHSVECNETLSDPTPPECVSTKPAEILESFGVLPELPPVSVLLAREEKATLLSVQEGDLPKKTSSPRSPVPPQDPSASLSSPLPSGPELDTGQRFFSFVILHAQEDEAIAFRVRDTLESLGVPDGATFCEEFQLPGRFELRCLQDAIDNSAFTVLLLTKHFDCHMSLHQVHMALINSITRKEKENSVIPFFPRESTLKSTQVSPLLRGLVSLDEKSPVFSKKVKSTFKSRKLQAQREVWKKQQEIQAIQEQTQQMVEDRKRVSQKKNALSDYTHEYKRLQQQLQSINFVVQNQGPFAYGYSTPQLPPWPHGLPTYFAPASSAFPANQLFPPMPFPPDPSSAPQLDPQSAGAQPLIIHNAHMVQLGLNNYMWGQKEGQGPSEEERTEEDGEDPGAL